VDRFEANKRRFGEPILAQANRFQVILDDPEIADLGQWEKCTGLQVTFETYPVEEGGVYDHEIALPKKMKYSPITLVRAVNPKDTPRVKQWLTKQVRDHKGGQVTITVYDHHLGGIGEKAEPVASWELRNARPKEWKCEALDAGGSKVLRETLIFLHEGFLET
jgi:phage tail-like protein